MQLQLRQPQAMCVFDVNFEFMDGMCAALPGHQDHAYFKLLVMLQPRPQCAMEAAWGNHTVLGKLGCLLDPDVLVRLEVLPIAR